MLTEVERWGFHVPEKGKVGVNVLGDEQVLWEHVAVKFEVHTKNSQTPDGRHWTPEIPNPRFPAKLHQSHQPTSVDPALPHTDFPKKEIKCM